MVINCQKSLIDKRFVFDLTIREKGSTFVYTYQALSYDDYKAWFAIMEGKELTPVYHYYVYFYIIAYFKRFSLYFRLPFLFLSLSLSLSSLEDLSKNNYRYPYCIYIFLNNFISIFRVGNTLISSVCYLGLG